MNNHEFETNILKLLSAQMAFLLALTVAREMFDKSYFALGQMEKIAVDQAVVGNVAMNFQNTTPRMFSNPSPDMPLGFQPQSQNKT